jgi:hypothetical protein
MIINVINTALTGDFFLTAGFTMLLFILPFFALPLLTGFTRPFFVPLLLDTLLRFCCALPPCAGRPFGVALLSGTGGLTGIVSLLDTKGLFGSAPPF